jgi:hypothetical protein
VDGGLIVLAEGVLRLLAQWSSPEAPALLVIEDLHWAGRETLEVIEYLADHAPGHAALIVATLRDDEPGPGGELVSALWAHRAVQQTPLSPLDPAQSEVMLRECLSAASLLPDLVPAGDKPACGRRANAPDPDRGSGAFSMSCDITPGWLPR